MAVRENFDNSSEMWYNGPATRSDYAGRPKGPREGSPAPQARITGKRPPGVTLGQVQQKDTACLEYEPLWLVPARYGVKKVWVRAHLPHGETSGCCKLYPEQHRVWDYRLARPSPKEVAGTQEQSWSRYGSMTEPGL